MFSIVRATLVAFVGLALVPFMARAQCAVSNTAAVTTQDVVASAIKQLAPGRRS